MDIMDKCVLFGGICAIVLIGMISLSSPSSGTFKEGALQGCVWVDTSHGTITRCPNSTTTTTYRVSTGKTSHVVSNTVVSE